MTNKLLLELFSEEIPPFLSEDAARQFKNIFEAFLQEKKIEFNSIDTYWGARRITLYITGLPLQTQGEYVEIKGPKLTAPEMAIEGFCQKNNIQKSQLQVQKIKDIEYYFWQQQTPPTPLKDFFEEAIPSLIAKYTWPKSMYWSESKFKWVRPLRNILCLYNEQIVNFQFGHLHSNNLTYGHRFINNSMIGPALKIANFVEYQQKLFDNYVIISHSDRKQKIQKGVEEIINNNNIQVVVNNNLLTEIANINEYPQMMMGKIKDKFLQLPQEVLITSMAKNQKYFYTTNKESGNFAPFFVFAADHFSPNHDVIIDGNERVLTSRLEDALYFYNRDLKHSPEENRAKLKNVLFHKKLGNLHEKSLRLEKIVQFLGGNKHIMRAALLCKTDITTEMVGEFPNLQGIMGSYYANKHNESAETCEAIKNHYMPQGANEQCATGGAACLSLADKMDNLTGLMIAGEAPTGSKDPFALRRQALGIIRLILENQININICDLIDFCLSLYGNNDLQSEIVQFLEDRIKYFLKSEYRQDIIAAVLDLNKTPNICVLVKRINSLNSLLDNNDELVGIYKRISNILNNQEYHGQVEAKYFVNDHEQKLYDLMTKQKPLIVKSIENANYDEAFRLLLSLSAPLASFFDNVMVNDTNVNIANNRKALLAAICDIFGLIADFGQIQ